MWRKHFANLWFLCQGWMCAGDIESVRWDHELVLPRPLALETLGLSLVREETISSFKGFNLGDFDWFSWSVLLHIQFKKTPNALSQDWLHNLELPMKYSSQCSTIAGIYNRRSSQTSSLDKVRTMQPYYSLNYQRPREYMEKSHNGWWHRYHNVNILHSVNFNGNIDISHWYTGSMFLYLSLSLCQNNDPTNYRPLSYTLNYYVTMDEGM